ncbi:unnamed protein product [Adineta ricciae]|uniref:Colicin E3-like ribonuclease domain-containing protein n=1 Tax=Adineta ricciae TaxID=249248 RepID=A0A814V9V4_ADIRI|nr:unnamed protein product [Adineta ricciae]CAF1185159.1 unnamed protein product [Adineta ricciae]
MSNPAKSIPVPSQSPIWMSLKHYRGQIKSNDKVDKFYEWDHTHGDIEVYNKRGEHLGTMDGNTGAMIKPAVKGRKKNFD